MYNQFLHSIIIMEEQNYRNKFFCQALCIYMVNSGLLHWENILQMILWSPNLVVHAKYLTSCCYLILLWHEFSIIKNEQTKIALPKNLAGRLPALTVKMMHKRSLLQIVVLNPVFLNVHPVLGAPMPEMKEPEVIR